MGRHDRTYRKIPRLAADVVHILVAGLILAVMAAPASVKVALACIAVSLAVAFWRAYG